MLNINRICCRLILFGLILLVPSSVLITVTDELIAYSLLSLAFVDCVFNGNWRRYNLLWIIVGIMTAYAIYSVFFLNYNTLRFILLDWIIELKPYLAFCVFFAVGPRFTKSEKAIVKIVCVINIAIVFILFMLGRSVVTKIIGHPAYGTEYAIICGTLFYLVSADEETNIVSRRNILIAILLMSVGILGFKAKFFGAYILGVFLMTLYRPGIMRNVNLKHLLLFLFIGALTLAATWNKIQYYFLTGNSDSFDPTAVQSFARPVLYMTAGLILVDHFPFGTGLASFATYASEQNYSNVYFEYGINHVHGLSPNYSAFICDAFYPSLAQFGFIGLILFIAFWVYIYSFLRAMIRQNPVKYRAPFVAGSIFIIFNLIEATSATTFTQTSGMISLAILGMICARGRELKPEPTENHLQTKRIKI